MTRTQNSIFNWLTGIGSRFLIIILSFITRSVFIRTLGEDYLGIEGLFSNILSLLSLTELGFGSAIVFKLYKPIAENNRPRILVLLKLYRRVYIIVGCVIAVLGLCLIPFLPDLIKDYGRLDTLGLNAIFIFLLYLFNSISSYWFFAYKTSFVQANQKSYLLNLLGYGLAILNSLCQIIVLHLTRNFVLYLGVQIAFSILTNLTYASVCDRKFPFTREKTSDRISKEELKEFFKDCSALFLYQASNKVMYSTANIVLSSTVGLRVVGLYANYLSVNSALRNLLYTFLSAIQASLGDLYSTGKLEWSRLIFRVVNFCTVVLYGTVAVGIAVLLDDFITLWLGSSFVVTSWTVNGTTIYTPLAILIGIEFFTTGQTHYCGSFRNAMGLFQELKFRPVASIIVNLAFSILLAPRLGIAGCVISTIIANITTNLLFDPWIIHKYALKQSPLPYFLRNWLYKLVFLAAGLCAWWVCSLIPLAGILGFCVKGVICVIIPVLFVLICFFPTMEFQYLLRNLKLFLHKPQ